MVGWDRIFFLCLLKTHLGHDSNLIEASREVYLLHGKIASVCSLTQFGPSL